MALISCPSCQARYRVSSEQFGGKPLLVKCQRCGHRWRQEAPAKDILTPPVPPRQRAETKSVELELQEISQQRQLVVGVSIFVTLILCLVGAYFAYQWWSDQQVSAGLTIDNVQHHVTKQGQQTTLLISGELINNSAQAQRIPAYQVELHGTAQHPLDQWPLQFDIEVLTPGETLPWKVRFKNPPMGELLDVKVVPSGVNTDIYQAE